MLWVSIVGTGFRFSAATPAPPHGKKSPGEGTYAQYRHKAVVDNAEDFGMNSNQVKILGVFHRHGPDSRGVAGKRWRGPTPPTKKRCTRMHMRLGPNTNRGAHTPPQPTSPKPHQRQQRPRPGMFSRRAKKCPRFRGRDWHDVSHATSFDGCRDARGCFGI